MHQLLQLLALNRNVPGRRFQALQAEGGDEATLYLYDTIVSDADTAYWCGGIDPMTFAMELASITAGTIHLRICSPGGDVFAARAMERALKEHPANIIAHIDGVAASAATYIALAANEVRINDGAMFMIHNAWTFAAGDKNDLTKAATMLGKIDGTLAKTYADKTGKTVEEIAPLMDAETWFTAQEAVDFGFADMIDSPETSGTQNRAAWNMASYKNAPRPVPERTSPAPKPDPKPEPDTKAMARRLAALTADV